MQTFITVAVIIAVVVLVGVYAFKTIKEAFDKKKASQEKDKEKEGGES